MPSMVGGTLISFLCPLFVAGLGSDLPECPYLEGLMMRDAISYTSLCECIIVGGGADVHESLHTRSHAHSPLLVRRHWPSRPFISEPYFQASWLHAPSVVGLLDDPGQVSSPFIASFSHLQNAGYYSLLHPVGAYKTVLFRLTLYPPPQS